MRTNTKQSTAHTKAGSIAEMLMILVGIGMIAAFIIRLCALCIFDIYDFSDKEAYRTIGITESTELRGTIYDSEGEVIAYSTPAYNLILSPYDILEYPKINEYDAIINNPKSSSDEVKNAQKEKKDREALAKEKARQLADMFATLFPDEVNYADLLQTITEKGQNGSRYYCLLRHIDAEDKARIESNTQLLNERNADDIENGIALKIWGGFDFYYRQSEKRVYPFGKTGAQVLGYVSSYDIAHNGLEEYYDANLSGIADRRITGKGLSSVITSLYDETYEGEDSVTLHTTLNFNIQKIVEDAIEKAQKETHAESVYAVVVNTKTCAILAMANTPGYNANDPDSPLPLERDYYEYLAENSKDEDIEANGTASATSTDAKPDSTHKAPAHGTITERTKNKALTDTFYPGSIYKAFLVAGALEEGMDIYYNCGGAFEIPHSDTGYGENRWITCALDANHGYGLDGEALLRNSCNICAAQLGLDMGSDTFFKYYEAFGFSEATGVDLFGGNNTPSTSIYYREYDTTGLATCSFGQNNRVSTLQLAIAMSAIGNGGYIMKPYIVASQTDDNGNVLSKTEPVVKRQAISEKVSRQVAYYLEQVVENGGGSRARLDNYYVSGKTGTSQIKDMNEVTKGYVASFAGFAPTTNPEITVVVNIIDPKNEKGGYSEILASNIAAPVAGTIFEQTLEYLGIPYDKTE